MITTKLLNQILTARRRIVIKNLIKEAYQIDSQESKDVKIQLKNQLNLHPIKRKEIILTCLRKR